LCAKGGAYNEDLTSACKVAKTGTSRCVRIAGTQNGLDGSLGQRLRFDRPFDEGANSGNVGYELLRETVPGLEVFGFVAGELNGAIRILPR